MATTYAFQKGKYGGQTGMIFPYFSDLPSNNPLEAEYTNNIPAGFLRCRGQILSADQYPELANVLGIGNSCIYKKENSVLNDPDEDGTGGTFQLPDLGSKYISAGTTPGSYNDMTVETTGTSTSVTYRAGVEVILSALNSEVLFTYTGNFSIPQHDVNISGQWTVRSNNSTGESTVFEGEILTHGHYATFAQLNNGRSDQCGGQWKWVATIYYCRNDPNIVQNEVGLMRLVPLVIGATEAGTNDGTTHRHSNANFVIPEGISTNGNITPAGNTNPGQTRTGTMAATSFSSSNIVTTVKLNTATTTKIDAVSPKFIICEYLIKI